MTSQHINLRGRPMTRLQMITRICSMDQEMGIRTSKRTLRNEYNDTEIAEMLKETEDSFRHFSKVKKDEFWNEHYAS